ncbi:MAG: prepilin-type N-terminal cleavage/methylation domain-containing protein [Deltaproteobacteria bacterium]|jgi:prepilin-type N-terminal cleavage/methylation domain-containing protein|nr:prepilin-type N-terminal cleavage/methylation domain-containing protein [Deltaproteobacteria bacterium]MDH3964914.1 prepilin-type N-terminal cleavage/methylation domain-containing protein [Deltaproteobacteria bacterium]
MKNQTGFTLLEILIALAIFAFGVLAVASMQMQGIRANNSSDTLTEATTLASDRMEKLMALNYGDPDLDLGAHAPVTISHHTISWNIVAGPLADTKRVSISVTWSERGSQRNVQMQFLKANLG